MSRYNLSSIRVILDHYKSFLHVIVILTARTLSQCAGYIHYFAMAVRFSLGVLGLVTKVFDLCLAVK